jgi:hypothetical protein
MLVALLLRWEAGLQAGLLLEGVREVKKMCVRTPKDLEET